MANAIIVEPLTMASITADTTAAGYATANLANDWMGLQWQSAAGVLTATLTIDLGADTRVDSIALFGLIPAVNYRLWSIDLATAAQGAFTGSFWAGAQVFMTWNGTAASPPVPISGGYKALWRAPAGAPASARYVRINVANVAGAFLRVSRIVIGRAIVLERNFRFGATFGVRPLGTVDHSARGVLLRRRGAKLRGVGITYPHVRRDEVQARVQPLLERVGNDTPILLVTDPDADLYLMERMFFGHLIGDLGTIWARPGGFEAQFNLLALD